MELGLKHRGQIERNHVLPRSGSISRNRLATAGELQRRAGSRLIFPGRDHRSGSGTDRTSEVDLPGLFREAKMPRVGSRNPSGLRRVGRPFGGGAQSAGSATKERVACDCSHSFNFRLDPHTRSYRPKLVRDRIGTSTCTHVPALEVRLILPPSSLSMRVPTI